MKLLMNFIAAVLALTGASSPEEIPETELERYQYLSEHPVELNSASGSKLLSCGLFSHYQVASIKEYIRLNGEILSFSELSLVDGFNSELVQALMHFVRIRSGESSLSAEYESIDQSLSAKSNYRRKDGAGEISGVLKYSGEANWQSASINSADLKISAKKAYGKDKPELSGISAELFGKRLLGRVVAGDFNSRLGMGLVSWSGFTIGGFANSKSFSRNWSGFSSTSSVNPEHRGMAVELNSGKVSSSFALSVKDKKVLPMASVQYLGKTFCLGTNAAYAENVGYASLNWSIGSGAINFQGESSVRISGRETVFAAVASLLHTPKYNYRYNLLIRYYPTKYNSPIAGAPSSSSKCSDEYGASAGMQIPCFALTLDASHKPSSGIDSYRLRGKYDRSFTMVNGWSLQPAVYVSLKYKTDNRNRLPLETRLDLEFGKNSFRQNARLHFNLVREPGYLVYSESGYDNGKLKLHARLTAFHIDSWDDRIYSYERDVPGSFSIPAYYGKGFSSSLLLGWKITGKKRASHSLNARLSYLFSSKNNTPARSSFEVHLFYRIDMLFSLRKRSE